MNESGDREAGQTYVEVASLGHHTDACPYLPDKVATLHFVAGRAAASHYHPLMDAGFRRSGRHFYRPQCGQCSACKVLRVPIAEFRPSKSQRNIYRKGLKRFEVSIDRPSFSPEKARVYAAYLAFQHHSDQVVDQAHYETFFVETVPPIETLELQFRDAGQLAGVGTLDWIDGVLSTVYFYFDPQFARHSLGTFSALYEIELARCLGCTHYYLGYYISACAAMAYKARFRPCEWKDPDAAAWSRMER